MGKYMVRECKGIGEMAVMESAQVCVRARARVVTMEESSVGATKRRRKVGGGDSHSGSEASSGNLGEIVHQERCFTPVSDPVPETCCSSNGSTQLAKESHKFADPDQDDERVQEIEASTGIRDREEKAPSSSSESRGESDDMESTTKPSSSEANSRPKSTAQMEKVSAAELEEFFAEAEKEWHEAQKEMSEKYNFDFEREVPLEGRFEWIPENKEELKEENAKL